MAKEKQEEKRKHVPTGKVNATIKRSGRVYFFEHYFAAPEETSSNPVSCEVLGSLEGERFTEPWSCSDLSTTHAQTLVCRVWLLHTSRNLLNSIQKVFEALP